MPWLPGAGGISGVPFRLKHVGRLCPGEPGRGPQKPSASSVLASWDTAGHRNPTHLGNTARSPRRGHRNGTMPRAVGVCALPPPQPQPAGVVPACRSPRGGAGL